jgi:hypothetical protein
MSREELLNLEKAGGGKNSTIETLLNQDNMIKGGKQLAPLQMPKKKM